LTIAKSKPFTVVVMNSSEIPMNSPNRLMLAPYYSDDTPHAHH
jgi:hypothetical protein